MTTRGAARAMTAFVFIDLDGVLTDSAEGITRSIAYALDEMSLPVPGNETLRSFIGPALQETFPKLGVEDVDRAIALYRERYTTVGLYESAAYEGTAEMLDALAGMGYRLALATAKPISYAAKITAHYGFDRRMAAQFGSEMDGRRTDKRDLLAYALETTGADPGASYMIGDRMHDARGALANGITPLGALWGFGAREELEAAGCAAIADAPLDIAALVKDLR